MADRLLIAVLGNKKSGKSTTWKRLFNTSVRTGKYERALYLNNAQSVNAFLINGSPEERGVDVGELLPELLPPLVLCSTQCKAGVKDTYDYFFKKGYEVIVQWLNPSYGDKKACEDDLSLQDFLLSKGATIQVRDGTVDPAPRVRELRQFILGWASQRDLVRTEWPV